MIKSSGARKQLVHLKLIAESGSKKRMAAESVQSSGHWAGCKLAGGGKQLAGATRPTTRKSPPCHDTTLILSTLDGFYYDKGGTGKKCSQSLLIEDLGDVNLLPAEIQLDKMCGWWIE